MMNTKRLKLTAPITVGCVMVFLFGAMRSPIVSGKAGTPAPQGEVAQFKNVNTWYLYCKVTVDGETGDENTFGDAARWSIHDIYSGSVALNSRMPFVKSNANTRQMSQQEKIAAAMAQAKQMNNSLQWMAIPVGAQRRDPLNGLLPLSIKIHEMTLYGGKDPCGDDEYTTNTRNGDGDDFSNTGPSFMADTQRLTYNVTIPLNPNGDKEQLTVKQEVKEKVNKQWTTTITPPGPHNVPFKDGRLFSLSKIKVTDPKRGGQLLKGGVIHHELDVPLDVVTGYIEFDSGDVAPDEPILSGNPETKEKVKVRVYYKISKTPIKPN